VFESVSRNSPYPIWTNLPISCHSPPPWMHPIECWSFSLWASIYTALSPAVLVAVSPSTGADCSLGQQRAYTILWLWRIWVTIPLSYNTFNHTAHTLTRLYLLQKRWKGRVVFGWERFPHKIHTKYCAKWLERARKQARKSVWLLCLMLQGSSTRSRDGEGFRLSSPSHKSSQWIRDGSAAPLLGGVVGVLLSTPTSRLWKGIPKWQRIRLESVELIDSGEIAQFFSRFFLEIHMA
jgi:hypothetical protein